MSRGRALVVVAALMSFALALRAPAEPANHGNPISATAEVARVRAHLAGAARVLRARDLTALSPAQRRARAARMADLRAYRARGAFPHNHRFPDRRTPVFVDEHGTRCAMAYLIERSGGGTLVQHVVATRNFARVRELADEPGLLAWLDRNGMTLAEAARIQPTYGGEGGALIRQAPEGADKVLGVAGLALSGLGFSLNLRIAPTQGVRNRRGVAGVACGIVGGVMGVQALGESEAWSLLASVDAALGLVSVGLGVRQLNAEPEARSSESGFHATPMTWREADGTRRIAIVAVF